MRRASLFSTALQIVRLRWWLMGITSVILVMLETAEHFHFNAPVDSDYLPEVLVFGILVPLAGGLILTVVDKALVESQRHILHMERQRLARELHDSVGQNLGYLHLKLEHMVSNEQLDATTLQELQRIRTVADDAYNQIRRTLVTLDSGDSTDIAAALFEHARLLGRRSNFEVDFEMTGQPAFLSLDAQLQLLNIFREALVNVEKHSGAHKVVLRFAWTRDLLQIYLEDDGKGFDMSLQPPEGHYGLKYMRQRADEIGANLSVTAQPGAGTRVTLLFASKNGELLKSRSVKVKVPSVPTYD